MTKHHPTQKKIIDLLINIRNISFINYYDAFLKGEQIKIFLDDYTSLNVSNVGECFLFHDLNPVVEITANKAISLIKFKNFK